MSRNNWRVHPEEVLKRSPIVPVMVIHRLEDALPMATALREGGIDLFEITLRTEAALESISLIKKAMPDTMVGAGTVTNADQYDAATAAGACFVISPGLTSELAVHALEGNVPLIPGCATPSEVMTALTYGFDSIKFFPAEANGGVKALKALSAPLPRIRCCPTGGINPANMNDYLNLECVVCVGSSWMLPVDAVKQNDWSTVSTLTEQAVFQARK